MATAPDRKIRTLLPMACDGVGPSQTCINLMRGAHRAGFAVDVFANRSRLADAGVPLTVATPRALNPLPYRWTGPAATRRLERMFLDAIGPDDIAYLWPAASLDMHRILHERGIPIVLEGINIRMSSARPILDAAYGDFGAQPSHSITDARIAEEEAKYGYAQAIFAPNRHVEAALKGSPLETRVIPTSYGVDTSLAPAERDYPDKPSLTYMFCGYACVRKGVHILLDVWRQMPGEHKLLLVGNIEPIIAERYGDLIATGRVESVGFTDNVHEWYARSDVFVFPSLEEGGPQVVYEAALHGLPMVLSPMGAGRFDQRHDACLSVDPGDPAGFLEALIRIGEDAALRARLGRRAREMVPDFDWTKVGAERAEKLLELFADTPPAGAG